MRNSSLSISNQKGSVLVVAMLIMVLLSILGISAIRTATTEVRISANERLHKSAFYAAESGWQVAVGWLDGQYPMVTLDTGTDVSGANLTFSAGKYASPDPVPQANQTNFAAAADYLTAGIAPGYSADFKRFLYEIAATGSGARNASAQLTVTAGKVEYVGGY